MYCNQCNQSTPEGAEFCPFCGGSLSVNTSEEKDEIPKKQDETLKEPKVVTNQSSNGTTLDLKEKMNSLNRFIENSSKIKTTLIVAGVLILILAGFNIFQLINSSTLRNEYTSLETKNATLQSNITTKNNLITTLTNENNSLNDQVYDYKDKADFLDEHIAFVSDDGTNLYHTYDCNYLDLSYFWAYNNEAAKSQGFYACPYCH